MGAWSFSSIISLLDSDSVRLGLKFLMDIVEKYQLRSAYDSPSSGIKAKVDEIVFLEKEVARYVLCNIL